MDVDVVVVKVNSLLVQIRMIGEIRDAVQWMLVLLLATSLLSLLLLFFVVSKLKKKSKERSREIRKRNVASITNVALRWKFTQAKTWYTMIHVAKSGDRRLQHASSRGAACEACSLIGPSARSKF